MRKVFRLAAFALALSVSVTPVLQLTTFAQGTPNAPATQKDEKPNLVAQLGHSRIAAAAAFSPDGHLLLTAGGLANEAILWDVETGLELRRFANPSGYVLAVAFSPDGRSALTGSGDGAVRLWEFDTGRLVRTFPVKGLEVSFYFVGFSSDGRSILAGCNSDLRQMLYRWDRQTGKETQLLQDSLPVALSPDGRLALLKNISDDLKQPAEYVVWDTALWQSLSSFSATRDKSHASFAADGRSVLTVEDFEVPLKNGKLVVNAPRITIWDTAHGEKIKEFSDPSISPTSAALAPDGEFILIGDEDGAILLSARTGKQVHKFEARPFLGYTSQTRCVAFSPDGHHVLTGSMSSALTMWEVASKKEMMRFHGQVGYAMKVSASPDGRAITVVSEDKSEHEWDLTTGKETLKRPGDDKGEQPAFDTITVESPSGRFKAKGSEDATARMWDAATGKEVRLFKGHVSGVLSVAFMPGEKVLVTGSLDGTTRLWDVETGTELCRLISFLDGTWAVVDPEGRFDASNGGDVKGLHWAVGNKPISLFQLKERYYEPGLLAKIAGFNKESPRDVRALSSVQLFPDVEYSPPPAGSTKLTIKLTNRGGGIGQVQVFVNDKEFVADARPAGFNPNAPAATLSVDLAGVPSLHSGANEIRVVARNGEGYLASRDVGVEWKAEKKIDRTPPELYAVVVGVSDYAGDRLDLRYAAKDAEDFAHALEVGAKNLFVGKDRIHVTLLRSTDDPAALQPTKANIQKAFAELAAKDEHGNPKIKPTDVLVVYLAGHGVTAGRGSDTYLYLTRDARSASSESFAADSELQKQIAVSSDELTEWIKDIPALKQVMILDTCAAGAAAVKLTEKRDLSGDQIRAIERLKDRTGFFILMGSAADSVSYEASRYGQGLLTYSLLQGMQGAALEKDGRVEVSRLFEHAADTVEQLAKGLGGIQKPEIKTPSSGGSFPIGLLTGEEKKLIRVAQPRPAILRPLLLDSVALRDTLGLIKVLSARLRDESHVTVRGREPSVVYFDVEESPGAILASGTYVVEGERVQVKLVLSQDGKTLRQLDTVEGSKTDVPGLIDKIMAAIADALRKLPATSSTQ